MVRNYVFPQTSIWLKYWSNTRYQPNISKMRISVSVLVTNMLVQIYWYRQKYRLAEYIGIGISWTHIGPTLFVILCINCLVLTCRESYRKSRNLKHKQEEEKTPALIVETYFPNSSDQLPTIVFTHWS